MNAYSDAKKMSHQELEIASQKILAKHSLSDVMRKTFLSYQTVWRLRKFRADREKASLVTLMSIVSAFPDDIK